MPPMSLDTPCPPLGLGLPDLPLLSNLACRLRLAFDRVARSQTTLESAVRPPAQEAAETTRTRSDDHTRQHGARISASETPEREGSDPDYDVEPFFVFVTDTTFTDDKRPRPVPWPAYGVHDTAAPEPAVDPRDWTFLTDEDVEAMKSAAS